MSELFGGQFGQQENIIHQAIQKAANNCEMDVYELMEDTPIASFCVFLNEALNELGYTITEKNKAI